MAWTDTKCEHTSDRPNPCFVWLTINLKFAYQINKFKNEQFYWYIYIYSDWFLWVKAIESPNPVRVGDSQEDPG